MRPRVEDGGIWSTPKRHGESRGQGTFSLRPRSNEEQLNKSDWSTAGVTVRIELFQDSYDAAASTLGVRDVYLGGSPAAVHGDNEGGE